MSKKNSGKKKPKPKKRKIKGNSGVKKKTKTTQIKKNKDAGSRFEGKMTKILNTYFEDNKITGFAYRFPSGRSMNQVIDILVDSEIVFAGVECKSIFTESLDNGKIYFSKLGNIQKTGLHQLQAQHDFLEISCRKGLIALQFRDLQQIYLIPHIDLVTIYESGDLYFTVEWIQTTYPILKDIDIIDYTMNLESD